MRKTAEVTFLPKITLRPLLAINAAVSFINSLSMHYPTGLLSEHKSVGSTDGLDFHRKELFSPSLTFRFCVIRRQ